MFMDAASQVIGVEDVIIHNHHEIIYPTNKSGDRLKSSFFEANYLCNNEPFQLKTEFADFSVIAFNSDAAYPHKTEFENAIINSKEYSIFSLNEKLGLMDESGMIILNPEYDNLIIYGDFNQIIIAVKDGRAIIFDGGLNALEDEITFLVRENRGFESPVFLREHENGAREILIYSNLGEEVFSLEIGYSQIEIENHVLWGDNQYFIYSLDGECFAINLFEPHKGIIASGVNLRHLFTILDNYQD